MSGAAITGPNPEANRPPRLIDCDVHSHMPRTELRRRLPKSQRVAFDRYGLRGAKSNAYVPTRPRAAASRSDSWPRSGGTPGSDPDFAAEQLLDRWGIDLAVINPIDALDFAAQPAAMAEHLFAALNDWSREAWLDRDPRWRATITVPFEQAEASVREIERLAGDSRFVAVMLAVAPKEPLGRRRYWEIFEAAVAHDLPVAIHVGGLGNNTVTGAGWPSFYFEDHMGGSHAMASQLLSLIGQGVFERFPDLRIVLEEGGLAWAPPLMWAMDSAWGQLADEVPHLQRPPSEYVREHVWFTTQPIEEPERRSDLLTVLEQLEMDHRIMFASDYPHWDFDSPERALPSGLSDSLTEAILGGNALRLFGLGAGIAG